MVDIKLVDYIKRHQQKGYKKEELQRILVQNGWLKDEVNEAFKFIETKQQPEKQKEKPVQLKEEKGPSRQEQLNVLKNFILSSRSKGISDFEIKNALRSKGWPEDLLEQGFRMFTQTQPQRPIIQPKPIQEKIEVKPKKERKPINFKKIIWFFIAFVVATLIITGTIFVYNYVIGLSSYTLTQNGEELHGKCLDQNCSDMKDSAFNYAKENFTYSLIVGLIASLITVVLYATLPFRNIILWVINGLYFLFLIYIGYIWLAFSSSV
ncbi:hypothetical protein J4438_03225 [Candidatus Woesearchaeota archaeon]|nr:hypothetical protein [Candidatus Woesearchaeota archaeon]